MGTLLNEAEAFPAEYSTGPLYTGRRDWLASAALPRVDSDATLRQTICHERADSWRDLEIALVYQQFNAITTVLRETPRSSASVLDDGMGIPGRNVADTIASRICK